MTTPKITAVTRDVAQTSAARSRAWRTRHNGGDSRSNWLERPFVAIDGEGYNRADGKHVYNMLCAHTVLGGREEYWSLTEPDGLKLGQILRWLLNLKDLVPNGNFVIYGASYDFNMMLSSVMDEKQARDVYTREFSSWNGYLLSYRKGKFMHAKDKASGRSVRVYDVVSFFQSTFVDACDSWLKDDFADREMIVANKAKRGTFTVESAEETLAYNKAELQNLYKLMGALRDALDHEDLRIPRWDGPGAIAADLFKRHNVKDSIAGERYTPSEIHDAAQYAYFGGRFENFLWGHTDKPVWEYDLNSAYPAAMRDLPDLMNGTWEHADHIVPSRHFQLVRYKFFNGHETTLPCPLPYRDYKLSTAYPSNRFEGWAWLPEITMAERWIEHTGLGRLEVLESWYFAEWSPKRPFAFVSDYYDRRLELKEQENAAEKALKLALNSMYGKLAQRIGARVTASGDWKLPPYHCLEWAGYITSKTRASLMHAIMDSDALGDVICFETDAVFTSKPLNVPVSDRLGEWGQLEYSDMTIIQSGFYWYTKTRDGQEVSRTRGVDRASKGVSTLNRDFVKTGIARELDPTNTDTSHDFLAAHKTQFVTLGSALNTDFAKWATWEKVDKQIRLAPALDSKRSRNVYPIIRRGVPYEMIDPTCLADNGMLKLLPKHASHTMSEKHQLPWRSDVERDYEELTNDWSGLE